MFFRLERVSIPSRFFLSLTSAPLPDLAAESQKVFRDSPPPQPFGLSPYINTLTVVMSKGMLKNISLCRGCCLTRDPLVSCFLCSSAQPTSVELKEEDFPSLSSYSAPPMATSTKSLSYTATAKASAFQEEDFPALVSKVRPSSKAVSALTSAWNNGSNKNMVKAAVTSTPSMTQLTRKPVSATSGKGSRKNKMATPNEDENGSGMTTQEMRSAPTMVDVSSLLVASNPQTFIKVGKKKKVGAEKQRPTSPPVSLEVPLSAAPVEKVPDVENWSNSPAGIHVPDRQAAVVNGHSEKSAVSSHASKEPPGLKPSAASQPLLPQEDFPALGSAGAPRMPPPPGMSCELLLVLRLATDAASQNTGAGKTAAEVGCHL